MIFMMKSAGESLEDIGCLVDMHKKAVVGVIHRCIYNEEERRELLLRKLAIILVLFSGIFFMNAAFSEERREVDESDCYYNLFVEASDIDSAIVGCADEFAKGNARSGHWLGVYYGEKNMPGKAFSYLQKAAEMGDAYSLFSIGNAYIDGYSEQGFPKDIDKGLAYIRQAAKDDGSAQYYYAYIHDRGGKSLGIESNLPVAWDYYNKAAENGNRLAMFELGRIYLYHGISGDCSREKGMTAEAALHRRNYYASLNIVCDKEKGLFYLERAAKMGWFVAQFLLGDFYFEEENWSQSKYWFSLLLAWERPLYDTDNVGSVPLNRFKEDAKQYMKNIPASTVVTVEDNLYERYWQAACQYKDHSWYYKCRKGENK